MNSPNIEIQMPKVWESPLLSVPISAEPGWQKLWLSLLDENGSTLEHVVTANLGKPKLEVPFQTVLQDDKVYTIQGTQLTVFGEEIPLIDAQFRTTIFPNSGFQVAVDANSETAAAVLRIRNVLNLSPIQVNVYRIVGNLVMLIAEKQRVGSELVIIDPVPRSWGETIYRIHPSVIPAPGQTMYAPYQPIYAHLEQYDNRIHVNSGPSLENHFGLAANPSMEINKAKPSTVLSVAGRGRPIALVGREQSETWQVAGVLVGGRWANVDEVSETLAANSEAVVRTPDGRWLQGIVDGTVSGWFGLGAAVEFTATSTGPGAGPLAERV